jgi:hypothetical protein
MYGIGDALRSLDIACIYHLNERANPSIGGDAKPPV